MVMVVMRSPGVRGLTVSVRPSTRPRGRLGRLAASNTNVTPAADRGEPGRGWPTDDQANAKPGYQPRPRRWCGLPPARGLLAHAVAARSICPRRSFAGTMPATASWPLILCLYDRDM